MTLPRDHPRYHSLVAREAIVEGIRAGYVAEQGLIAHGRGEAFDYLLGEQTTEHARAAVRAGAAALVSARRPVLSVNGNVAALLPAELARLQKALGCRVEVNLFHRTDERVRLIVERLAGNGCRDVLGATPDARIPGLSSDRALASKDGIHGADCVLVPLEDGDRCEALLAMGKRVVTIDLNPLSRTARKASITIVDNVVRAVPALAEQVAALGSSPRAEVQALAARFDNAQNLALSLSFIRERLAELGANPERVTGW